MKHVAVGILRKNGQVLACQRRREARYPLKWEFPGGKLEAAESAEQAVVRELREELSVNAIVGKELFRQKWVYPANASDEHLDGVFAVTYFLIESFEGVPTNNTFEQIKWVTPAALLTMDILEGNKEAVELLVKHAESDHTT